MMNTGKHTNINTDGLISQNKRKDNIVMAAIGKIKNFSAREFNKILANNGFELVRKKGDHYIFKRDKDTVCTTNGSNGMNIMVIRRLIKQYNLYF